MKGPVVEKRKVDIKVDIWDPTNVAREGVLPVGGVQQASAKNLPPERLLGMYKMSSEICDVAPPGPEGTGVYNVDAGRHFNGKRPR